MTDLDIAQKLKEAQLIEAFKLVQCPTCSFRKICAQDYEQITTCLLEEFDSMEHKITQDNDFEFTVGKAARKLIKHVLRAVDQGINVGIVKYSAQQKHNNLSQIRVKKGSRKDRRANKYSTMAHLYTSNAQLMSALSEGPVNVNEIQGYNLYRINPTN